MTAADSSRIEYQVLVARQGTTAPGLKAVDDFNNLAGTVTDVQGVWSNETTMWVAADGTDVLYAYTLADRQRDGTKDITLDAANTDPRGIHGNANTLWVADSEDNKFYAYKLTPAADFGDRDSAKDITLDSANASPWGIWSDDTPSGWRTERTGRFILTSWRTGPGPQMRTSTPAYPPGT